MKLSVIIPSLNGKKLLEEMLPTIPQGEIIVVDNGSTDGTVEFLQQNYPKIQRVAFSNNKGFTGACNAGAKKATGEYLLFINNDCFIKKKDLQLLIDLLDREKSIVATQPIVKTPQGIIQNIGFVLDISRAKAKEITTIEEVRDYEKETVWPPQTTSFYGLSATCLLIRKETFIRIGMFDESFHSYLEDIDLMIRLAAKGYMYKPCLQATCVHKHMSTSKKMGLYKPKQDFFNWVRIIVKNYPINLLLSNFLSLTIERSRNINGIIKAYRKQANMVQ